MFQTKVAEVKIHNYLLTFLTLSYELRHMTFPPLLFSFVDKMIKNFCLEVIHYNN